MIVLTLFAFLGGFVTILSPCILPILPIVLSGSLTGGKSRPLGVVAGFIVSFTFFTLFLSFLVKFFGIPGDILRSFSVLVILLFGISLLVAGFQNVVEKLFASLSRFVPNTKTDNGFFGGLIVGLSIGLLWTPCVGPILASIISLAITGLVTGQAVIITFAYALGTAIPMLGIVWGGRNLLNKVPGLVKNTANIQKGFGVLMIITAFAIYFNLDRSFQVYILDKFPSYGVGLTKIEDNQLVKNALEGLRGKDESQLTTPDDTGKPMFQVRKDGPIAPEIIPGGEWFNLSANKDTLTLSELRGKVVLVDFWTYTCINCIRTLPYLRDWHEKYSDLGFVILGIHTPEFEFEKEAGNVKKAIDDFGLKYPIVQDNNYATWRAYKNRYWPAKYLIDKNGVIRYTHFGEGKYDETEKNIQKLLAETGEDVSKININTSTYSVMAKTPELYLGNWRIEYFASPERIVEGLEIIYSKPKILPDNHFAYEGYWNIGNQTANPAKSSKLILNFNAKEVFLVMKPESNESKVKVYLNGSVVGLNKGADVDENGIVTLDKDRLYKLINLHNPGKNELMLEFLDGNTEVYAFTFG